MSLNIGVFQGREKKYNRLVFESLSREPLKEWDLAKNIYKTMKARGILPKRWKNKDWYHTTQKIYTVLIRKKQSGRLPALSSDGYIEKIDDKWELTSMKGVFTSWLSNSNIQFNQHYWDKSVNVRRALQILPFLSLAQLQKKQTDLLFGLFFELRHSPSFIKCLFVFMRNRVTRGELDLDRISNEHFNELIFKETFGATYTSILPFSRELRTEVSRELNQLMKRDKKLSVLLAQALYFILEIYHETTDSFLEQLEPIVSRYKLVIEEG